MTEQTTAEPPATKTFTRPTTYVVSCLPEGHDDRYTYTIAVLYRGKDQYVVHHGMRYLDANGEWDYEDEWDDDDQAESAWWSSRRFDLDTALRLAGEQAAQLSYMGRPVADVLAGEQPAAEGAQR
jgi:hypothetical protein